MKASLACWAKEHKSCGLDIMSCEFLNGDKNTHWRIRMRMSLISPLDLADTSTHFEVKHRWIQTMVTDYP